MPKCLTLGHVSMGSILSNYLKHYIIDYNSGIADIKNSIHLVITM